MNLMKSQSDQLRHYLAKEKAHCGRNDGKIGQHVLYSDKFLKHFGKVRDSYFFI
jgi:hypothetical protein